MAGEFRDGTAIAALHESGELIADATRDARQGSGGLVRLLAALSGKSVS